MIIKKLLKLVAPAAPSMGLALLCTILTIAANIGLLATSALLIASAALHPPLAALAVAITGVRFFGISRAVFRYAERYIAHSATFQILASLRVWFYSCLEPLAPARLGHYKSGDLLSRLTADIDTLQYFYLRVLGPPFAALIILLAMAWWLSCFAPVLSLLLVAAFILAGVVVPYCIHLSGKAGSEALLSGRAKLKAVVVDTLEGITELAAFRQIKRQQEQVAAIERELNHWKSKTAMVGALTESLNSLIMNSTVWGALVLTAPLVAAGKLESIYLAVLLLAIQASFEAIQPLPLAAYYLAESIAAAQRLFALAGSEPAVHDSSTAVPVPDSFALSFSHVDFTYPGEVRPALRDISISLPAGKRLAIVGANGAGKTTLTSLLLRFWDYKNGSIQLGGHELREYPAEVVRRYFAVVSQQTHLFHASIADNIRLARPEAVQEEVIAAARYAAIHEFIHALPQGYESLAGNNGKAISGGQRQRLSIARALLKNAPILILDEPTVGLDAVTAQEVMAVIADLMKGRTTILVTHTLTGLQLMDEIIVLDHGQIVEQGTFEQLLIMEGLFYQMWRLQQDII